MPLGFRKKGKVLKLKKTLHDLCNVHGEFWNYLVENVKVFEYLSPNYFHVYSLEKGNILLDVDDLLFSLKDKSHIYELGIFLHDAGVE